MTPIEEAQEFIGNQAKMEKYNQAVNLLRDAGFESLLRRLGEPSMFPFDHPMHSQISAFEHAERRGWYQLLEHLFNFQAAIQMQGQAAEPGDFGAKEQLAKYRFDLKDL